MSKQNRLRTEWLITRRQSAGPAQYLQRARPRARPRDRRVVPPRVADRLRCRFGPPEGMLSGAKEYFP